MSPKAEMNCGRKIVRQCRHSGIPLTVANPQESPRQSRHERPQEFLQQLLQELRECRREIEDLREYIESHQYPKRESDTPAHAEKIGNHEAKGETSTQKEQVVTTAVLCFPTSRWVRACFFFRRNSNSTHPL